MVNETKAPLERLGDDWFSTLCEQFVDIYDQTTAKKMSPLKRNTMEVLAHLREIIFSSDIQDKELWFRKPNDQTFT